MWKLKLPQTRWAVVGNQTWQLTLISRVYLVLPSGKEISEKKIVQHPGSKKLISSNWASRQVGIGLLRRGNNWKLFHSISVISLLSVGCFCGFFAESCCRPFFDVPNRYIVPENSWNRVQTVILWPGKDWQEPAKAKAEAAAGAQTPLAGKHFADFLLTFAAVFFFPWDLNFAA